MIWDGHEIGLTRSFRSLPQAADDGVPIAAACVSGFDTENARTHNADRGRLTIEARSGLKLGSRGSKKQMAFAVSFAALWNAIALPASFLAWTAVTEEGEKGVLFVFIFPLVGVFLMAWAIRSVMSYRKFSVSVTGGKWSGWR